MRLLKAKALTIVAIGLAWYAVGGPRLLAKRLAFATIDRVIGKPKAKVKPPADQG